MGDADMTETGGKISNAHRRWFSPPRAHGDSIEDRTVSFLELFYDLVFVVLIAQLAHTLAGHIDWTGFRNFAVVFGLIWIAWLNGTMYHELHGGDDGRSRMYIFGQMTLMVLLAVFAGHAADDLDDGRNFAIVYTLLLLFIAWQWFDVRRFDVEEWRPIVMQYVTGMLLIAAVVLASAFVDSTETRVLIWAVAVVLTLVGGMVFSLGRQSDIVDSATQTTESLAERFGLFTIIVLGEVVVGVVEGISEAEHHFRTIATGILALWVGFGFWWNYFDFVGGRVPRPGRTRVVWLNTHFLLALCISAAGAAMVSLVGHGADARTGAASAWLLSATTAGILLSIAMIINTFDQRPGHVNVSRMMVIAAVGALVVGAFRPAPWLFVLLLGFVVSVPWQESFTRHARLGLPFIPEEA
ncbi:MAG: low temperature requirement protein A [bacterium]|nr:low temperature requirement protein A [bacterium]